jgi:hypothetical protein
MLEPKQTFIVPRHLPSARTHRAINADVVWKASLRLFSAANSLVNQARIFGASEPALKSGHNRQTFA